MKKDSFESTDKAYMRALASLVEAACKLSAAHYFEEVETIVIEEVKRIFDAGAAWILVHDYRDEQLKMRRYWGPEKHLFEDCSIKVGVGIAGKVFASQESEIISTPASHPASMFYKKPISSQVPAIAMYPLIAGRNNLGILGFSSSTFFHEDFTEFPIDIAETFVEFASAAFERAVLFEYKLSSERELRSGIKSLQVLNEIGMDLVSDLDIAAIIDKVVRYAAEILDADAAVVNIADKMETTSDSVYFYNMPSGTAGLLKARGTLARGVFENPRQVLINDYSSYPGAIDEFVQAGLSSVIMVPVISKNTVLATLSAISFNSERCFSVDEFGQLELVARHVAIAIENAILYNEQIRTRRQIETYAGQLRLLNEASQIISREKGPINMAVQLAKSSQPLLDCSAATVLLVRTGADKGPVITWSTRDDNFGTIIATGLDIATLGGLYGEMYQTKRPIRLDDVENDPRSRGLPSGHMELDGLLGAPLLDSNNEFIGQVMLTGKSGDGSFTKTDEELLVALCAQVSVAIEKAEAYERQHRIAETLQQAILAVPTHLPGVEVGIAYESAAEAAKVGGDFYDLFELGAGRIGVLIGDVSGKGLEAATITSMVKSTIRAFAYTGLEPSAVLTEANKVICEQLRYSQFVTMTFGIIDIEQRMLFKSRAGHPEAILGRNQCFKACESESNLPLGILSDVIYVQNEFPLLDGDMLVLYTDGLIEAKCDHKILGDEYMLDRLNQIVPGKGAQELASEMVTIAKDFTGSRLEDDIAIVTLKLVADDNWGLGLAKSGVT
jgi:serine phosphatase RsbU (regulator of sigma subunit)